MEYYSTILAITESYLGPAAERFIARQVKTHFRKNPEELKKEDIPMLAIRIRSGLMVLTRDEKIVGEAFHRINEVGN